MTQNRISGLAVAVLGLVVFFITPYQVDSYASAVLPRILSFCLVVLGILVAMTSKNVKKEAEASLLDPLLLIYFVLIFGSIIAIRTVGYYPAILLLIFFLLLLFGERKLIRIALFSVIVTGLIYLIMEVIFGSNLP